ncbi:hypothetical protein G9U52_17435 [Paenibacillus sp. S3N08]|uniref:Transposon Tn7 transposition protein TnsD C-termianl domain-containing protein n=2 Tax=Paenibacillus agricola TaxID=2716264 RepID=A0ABX0J5N1_9BACL|nr:hypothetical protein [Paenibacillus agricola]
MAIADTMKSLFNLNTHSIRHLPRNLNYLLDQMPNIDALFYLKNNTVYPLIKSFLTLKQNDELLDDILNGVDGGTSLAGQLSGSGPKGLINEEIRYCPACLSENYAMFGECYVNRYHQLKDINICLKHKCGLISKCPECYVDLSSNSGQLYLKKPVCPLGHSIETNTNSKANTVNQLDYDLMTDIIYLMENQNDIDVNVLIGKLLSCLGEKVYIHPSGLINKTKLIHEFFELYSEQRLTPLIPEKNYFLERRTVKRLLRSEFMNLYIIFYLLLMRFLSGSVGDFLDSSHCFVTTLPFGAGPWSCHNTICESHGEMKIMKYKRLQRNGSVSGEFACPICGFTYTRKKEPLAETDAETYFIKAIGEKIINKIVHMSKAGIPMSHIASEVCVSESTVAKYAKHHRRSIDETTKQVAINEIKLGMKEVGAAQENSKRDQYREVIRNALHTDSSLNRKTLKKLQTVKYNWLMKNDRSWMEDNLPPVRKSGNVSIDIRLLDQKLSQQIKIIVEMLFIENPQKRIKPHTILSKLSSRDFGRYSNLKDQLPLTKMSLQKHSEQEVDYLNRILPEVINFLKKNRYNNIDFESLKIRRGYRNCSTEDRIKIEKELNRILNMQK